LCKWADQQGIHNFPNIYLMKTFFLSLILFFVPFSISAQTLEESPIDTKIDSVTVFLEGAQIHRSGLIEAPQGRSKWVLKGLSPFIDPQSVQIKTKEGMILLSVNHRINYLEKEDKGAFQEEILALQDSILILDAFVKTLSEEEKFLKANQAIGGAQTGIKPEDLQTLNAYYVERIQAIRLNTLTLKKRINVHNQRIQQLQSQVNQVGKDIKKVKGEVVFELDCKRAQKAGVSVSYTTGQAWWFPLYDIRAKDVNSDIELVYRARVRQNTGEDWEKVKLTFSNADPSASGVIPQLSPWYLSFRQVVQHRGPGYGQDLDPKRGYVAAGQVTGRVVSENGEPLIGVNVVVEGTTIGTVTDLDGNFTLTLPPGRQNLQFSYIGFQNIIMAAQPTMDVRMQESEVMLDAIVVTGTERYPGSRGDPKRLAANVAGVQAPKETVPTTVIESQTNFSFRVDLPYTLLSDGKMYTVDLTSFFIPAYYEYQSVPKLDESAYLIARITDWDQYNLLEGEANLFFEDTYVGKSILDVRFVADTLDISLGKDRNVLVKRTKVVDFSRRRFIGSNKLESRTWKLEVRNQKAQAINLVLYDQFPISKQNQITVETQELAGAEQNVDTGELKWSLRLDPKEKRAWEWGYTVKYPKDRNLMLE